MPPIEVRPDIFWIGVNDHRTELFEGLWPIKTEGISYNTYLIQDEKTAIIDLTREMMTEPLLEQLERLNGLNSIDYIIVNHMEPDHSGALGRILEISPQAIIVGTPKAKDMLESFYGITERIQIVEDGETLNLGKHTLRFVHTPFVHWPETMMTVEEVEGILFSCDGFGGYGHIEEGIFDDEVDNLETYKQEALRYFTNIVAKYSKPVLKAIQKLNGTTINIVAPSHGLIWRKQPETILGLYQDWAELAGQPGAPAITLLHASMYGNTTKMMEAVARGIEREGVAYTSFDVTRTHASYILPSLWQNRGVIIGSPTYDGSLFPPMAHLMDYAVRKRIQGKTFALFGSYAWSAGARKDLEKLLVPLKWNWIDTLEFAGGPDRQDIVHGEELGALIARTIQNEGA